MNDETKMFLVNDSCPRLACPWCEAVPHLVAVAWGRGFPPASTSGPGLVLQYECEWGHNWKVNFVDHSGSTWFSIEELADSP